MSRFMAIWFPNLIVERTIKLRPELKEISFIVAMSDRGRMIIKAASQKAVKNGVNPVMAVADARALIPELQVFKDKPGTEERLLKAMALWCLRFAPVVAVDLPDGLLLDISGCPHLWGGEQAYLKDITHKFKLAGYSIKAGVADTISAAWAVARYSKGNPIIEAGQQLEAISFLPPAALRLEAPVLERMRQLGFYTVGSFVNMPDTALRRRFGQGLLDRIGQVLGRVIELLEPVQPPVIFQVRLPCLEPIKTRTGIDIALKTLLEELSQQLSRESKGLRTAVFKCFRVDNTVQQVEIGTNRPVRNVFHLLKLFEQKIDMIRPALGIELFALEAPTVEDLSSRQESLWGALGTGNESEVLANLLDRIAGKVGAKAISRYLPAEHYWPERAVQLADSLYQKATTDWRDDRPRPVCLLTTPEPVNVTAPIPDYPPMLFIYQGKIHKIKKADGPERIEREWWLEQGLVRDYYVVEDEAGGRYWLFRSGHYDDGKPDWFIHGFFA